MAAAGDRDVFRNDLKNMIHELRSYVALGPDDNKARLSMLLIKTLTTPTPEGDTVNLSIATLQDAESRDFVSAENDSGKRFKEHMSSLTRFKDKHLTMSITPEDIEAVAVAEKVDLIAMLEAYKTLVEPKPGDIAYAQDRSMGSIFGAAARSTPPSLQLIKSRYADAIRVCLQEAVGASRADCANMLRSFNGLFTGTGGTLGGTPEQAVAGWSSHRLYDKAREVYLWLLERTGSKGDDKVKELLGLDVLIPTPKPSGSYVGYGTTGGGGVVAGGSPTYRT